MSTSRAKPLLTGLAVAACLLAGCTSVAPSTQKELPDDQVAPAAPGSLFDSLAGEDRLAWRCTGEATYEFVNDNCYVDLCRGTFTKTGEGAGIGTYRGLMPTRSPDLQNPTVALPTNDPLILELTFQSCESPPCPTAETLTLQSDGSGSDTSGKTLACRR